MGKRIISILIIGILAFSLTACGSVGTKGASKGPEGELSDIIDKIYEKKPLDFPLQTTKLDITDLDVLKYNTGLSDASLVKEAAVSEAMISSMAYSLALVRVNDSKDAKTVAQQMLDGIDQRKWICVEADDLKVAGCGDVVMLVMVADSLSDTVTAQQLVDEFKAVCGGNQDFILEK